MADHSLNHTEDPLLLHRIDPFYPQSLTKPMMDYLFFYPL
ncbi:hypothetical protein EDWATA_03932 [Edwardsiella tarda ATCC 23685]|uniref:Uncharacterized protein n=1 Tax=Edwardsiella tarda ATCC 23685 TaxID=500638 RepID=D4FAW1_EDWTA|nr:hypothetical protein EDWATA_03932 [Edwardsiella tarda ATCC 23685]